MHSIVVVSAFVWRSCVVVSVHTVHTVALVQVLQSEPHAAKDDHLSVILEDGPYLTSEMT